MTLELLKTVLAAKGYLFFSGDKNINLIGVRKNDHLTNQFDDKLFVVIELNGQVKLKEFDEFTTDPGDYYIKEKLLNEDGCAMLKPGQYRGMLKLGKHRGKYPALVQAAPCIVYRDANRDDLIDKGIEDEGIFGINMHHAYDSEEVDRNSAGCQVHSEDEQLNYILRLCEISAEVYGDSFTYTLLEEKDFEEAEEVILEDISKKAESPVSNEEKIVESKPETKHSQAQQKKRTSKRKNKRRIK